MRVVSASPLKPSDTSMVLGLATIMRMAFGGDNLSELTSQLIDRIQTDASDAAALLDLSIVMQLNAQPAVASELQAQALRLQQHYALASNPFRPSLRLLAIMGPGEVMANTPIEFLIEESDVSLELLYLGAGLPVPAYLPEHDIAFVAVCESDQNRQLLKDLNEVMQHWPKPFINAPSAIALLNRSSVSRNLSSIRSLVASDAHRLTRAEISDLAGSDCFPVIARPVNSHAGCGLEKLENQADLLQFLETQSSQEFFVAPFIDYRSADGWFRKYRITILEGQPFAAHMAISRHWMVHYLNADMLNNCKNRDEEASFMSSFDSTFATKHALALEEIDRCIGLDYYSIDCAETIDGRLLVFEIDSGAVVHSMDPVDVFPYKAPQMARVFNAFQQMLHRRVQSNSRRLVA